MAKGTITGAYTDDLWFYLHVNVPGDTTHDGKPSDVEYQGRTLLLDPSGRPKGQQQLTAEAAADAARWRASTRQGPVAVPVTGTVEV